MFAGLPCLQYRGICFGKQLVGRTTVICFKLKKILASWELLSQIIKALPSCISSSFVLISTCNFGNQLSRFSYFNGMTGIISSQEWWQQESELRLVVQNSDLSSLFSFKEPFIFENETGAQILKSSLVNIKWCMWSFPFVVVLWIDLNILDYLQIVVYKNELNINKCHVNLWKPSCKIIYAS